jgi:presequence protease
LSRSTEPAVNAHPSFRWLRQQFIESLNLEVQEFEHIQTGAMHYHLASDSTENVFLVALRTVPQDSRGVAHILEHTALCGSEKYPVRDPFFMMLRRSLNTFMNAFTSSDWTAYPFASQNKKDFSNLLDVYLDAVFFSRLDPLDFAQEGHRVEFKEAENPDSELVYKGVVYNEMKGAMSSTVSTLWQTVTKYLYPETTYHFNSGGEPDDIPALSYQQLLEFYRTHYHPSNAVFMTFGDMPADELQERFHEQALQRFQRLDAIIEVPDEKRYHAPVAVQEHYASETGEADDENKVHHVLAWLLGDSTDLQAQLEAHLLSNVLLGDSSSPLQLALETTELGSSPSPLCGLEDSNREMCFMCGLEGSSVANAEAFQALVLQTLQQVAEEGVEKQRIEAVLHQLELSQREVRGDGMPYGLGLILSSLSAAIHRGDAIACLNLDPVLEQLRTSIQDPNYIKGLAQKLLLDNNHRVRLSLLPDAQLDQRKMAAEAQRLAKMKAALTAQDKQQIIDLTKALAARQEQVDDADILPKVGIEDVPLEMNVANGEEIDCAAMPGSYFVQGTNGLVYQQIVIELPALEPELLAVLPYYTSCLTELGVGERSYLDVQAWQSQVAGSIHVSSSVRGQVDDEQQVKGYLTLSAKSLSRHYEALCELVYETLNKVRFDETDRLADLIAQRRAGAEQSVTGNGHGLAMQAASSGMSPTAAMMHRLTGLQGINSLKALDDSLRGEGAAEAMASLVAKMKAIHARVLLCPRQVLLVAEAEQRAHYIEAFAAQWRGSSAVDQQLSKAFSLSAVRTQVKQVWATSTQVNFCAKAYPTVPVEHADAAALTVLGEFLRNGYLHRVIREQGGAYGGGASQDSTSASFRFYSYRDPRLQQTLDDFDASLAWLLDTEHSAQSLEEAILGVVSSIDKPASPAGEARQAFHNNLFGRTAAQRTAFRQRILAVSLADLQHVAKTYLQPEKASIAVVTNADNRQKLVDLESYEQLSL